MPNNAFWAGKRVLVTGHTGFKGSWLWVWLRLLGADVRGIALAPDTEPSLWGLLGASGNGSRLCDIRDRRAVEETVRDADPHVLLHLAAQPLVRRSYVEPLETVATNVMGTANVLNAARVASSLRAVVSVTTDKCYLNVGSSRPFHEDDPLGGHDPYSASKAAADILSAAWRDSFLAERGVGVATARAGNVIGGGDWAVDRLLPDCLSALERGDSIAVRNPDATRPWQHVLEPLAGYLLLAERLYETAGKGDDVSGAWNFGPDATEIWPVRRIVDEVVSLWGGDARWHAAGEEGPHEADLLAVDATKARARLGWRQALPLSDALQWTTVWHRRHRAGEAAEDLVVEQIHEYERL